MALPELSSLMREVSGAFVWGVANLVYLDRRRRGRRGFARLLAFWFGMPVTWATLFFVREAEEAPLHPAVDDEEALLREVRRDRALREGEDDAS